MATVANTNDVEAMPVVRNIKDFDQKSGNLLERLVFNNRRLMIFFSVVITLFLAWQATHLVVNAGYEKMLPQEHPYIQNYFKYQNDLRGLGNSIRVVVEHVDGDIFDPDYLETLRQINDELFLTPGVDRAWMKSLWTPSVRWTEVTEDGFAGGPLISGTYNGSQLSIDELKMNIDRAGIVGQLVANDFKSSMIFVPLLNKDSKTGASLDYSIFSKMIETNVRDKYEFSRALEKQVEDKQTDKIRIHVVGFAKLVGDLIDGIVRVMVFFLFAAVIAAVLIYIYTRCIRSTVLVLGCSMVAIIWQLGIVNALGFELDPYSVLVSLNKNK